MRRRLAGSRLLDLFAELLVAIATQLTANDELAASLACRKLREAMARTERRMVGKRLSTRIGSALESLGKLEWAVSRGHVLTCSSGWAPGMHDRVSTSQLGGLGQGTSLPTVVGVCA
jgi:hypothetical protein